MKRSALLLTAAILFLPEIAAGKMSPEKIYKEAGYACAVYGRYNIQTILSNGSTETFRRNGSGSCAAISFNGEIYILTNAHVVKHADKHWIASLNRYLERKKRKEKVKKITKTKSFIFLAFKDKPTDWLLVSVKNIDSKKDLARLVLRSTSTYEQISGIEIENKEIIVGDSVATIGSPNSISFTLTLGNIANIIEGYGGGPKKIMTNSMVGLGSSGGPLINERGKLIGITKGSYFDTAPHFSFFIHRDDILEYLEKIQNSSP